MDLLRIIQIVLVIIIAYKVIKKFIKMREEIEELSTQLKLLKTKVLSERRYSIKNVDRRERDAFDNKVLKNDLKHLEEKFTLQRMYQQIVENLEKKNNDLKLENEKLKKELQQLKSSKIN